MNHRPNKLGKWYTHNWIYIRELRTLKSSMEMWSLIDRHKFFDTSPSRGKNLCPSLSNLSSLTTSIINTTEVTPGQWYSAGSGLRNRQLPLSVSWNVHSWSPATMLSRGPGHVQVSLLKIIMTCDWGYHQMISAWVIPGDKSFQQRLRTWWNRNKPSLLSPGQNPDCYDLGWFVTQ